MCGPIANISSVFSYAFMCNSTTELIYIYIQIHIHLIADMYEFLFQYADFYKALLHNIVLYNTASTILLNDNIYSKF